MLYVFVSGFFSVQDRSNLKSISFGHVSNLFFSLVPLWRRSAVFPSTAPPGESSQDASSGAIRVFSQYVQERRHA